MYNLNLGPQHPSAHGVLRLLLLLNGEKVYFAAPHIGLLHRGTEKLFEYKLFLQNVPYFDRLDYVSMLAQEQCFALSVEKSLNFDITYRSKIIRVLVVEMTRILNHLMAITTHALDIGAITPFLQGFEEREKLFEFYERISGARMHTTYIIPGGVSKDIPISLLNDLFIFLIQFLSQLNVLEDILTGNRIQKNRLVNIGLISKTSSLNFNISGVLLRSIGIVQDLRKVYPYDLYNSIPFNVIFGVNGDCFDRYLIRLYEMRESCFILFQCINALFTDSSNIINSKILFPSRVEMKNSMEDLIHHFKLATEGFSINFFGSYLSVESPKGELGVFLIIDENNKPYRCKVKAPGFSHLHSLNTFILSHFIADVVTVIGTQDIVFGEIDK